jgi:hypothetical protein
LKRESVDGADEPEFAAVTRIFYRGSIDAF